MLTRLLTNGFVPLQAIQNRELTITGIFRYANTYPLALALLASGAARTGDIITHRFDIANTEDAVTLARPGA